MTQTAPEFPFWTGAWSLIPYPSLGLWFGPCHCLWPSSGGLSPRLDCTFPGPYTLILLLNKSVLLCFRLPPFLLAFPNIQNWILRFILPTISLPYEKLPNPSQENYWKILICTWIILSTTLLLLKSLGPHRRGPHLLDLIRRRCDVHTILYFQEITRFEKTFKSQEDGYYC